MVVREEMKFCARDGRGKYFAPRWAKIYEFGKLIHHESNKIGY